MIKAAVIGLGNMGKNHARIYNELEDVELLAVCDTNQERVDIISRKYNTKGFTDYQEMLSSLELDFVSIVVPTSSHLKTARDVINSGVSALIEKPIAGTPEEADEIIRLSEEKGVKISIGHIERFNPAIRELKRRVKNGELGKIFKIHADRAGPFPPRIRDVGVIRDLSVHDLDIMRFIAESEVVRVYAECEQNIHTSNEDLLCGTMKFESGCIGSLNVNWLTPKKIRKLTVLGEKGMFVADYITQSLYFYENRALSEKDYSYSDIVQNVLEGNMTKILINSKEPLREELAEFTRFIKTGEGEIVSPADGRMAIVLANKLIESEKEHKAVNI
jgi:predicted dehydrogenase